MLKHFANIEAKHITVVAPPGSGKTHTLCAALCLHMEHYPDRKAIITYTNAGAAELRARLGDRANDSQIVYIGTLHGFCFKLLQSFGDKLGYRRGSVNLATPEVSDDILQEIAKRLNFKGTKKELAAKSTSAAKLIWAEHAHTLKRNNLVDYDTVLTAGRALLAMPWAFFPVHSLYVDEAQDSAQIDWDIYHLINAAHTFVIGDVDQSIFEFRGAWPLGFVTWAKRVADDAETHVLHRNYRSGREICAAADRLIAHNMTRIASTMVPSEGYSHIHAQEWATSAEEMYMIAGQIIKGDKASSVAVLCRTNHHADEIANLLEAMSVPVARAKRPNLPADYWRAVDVLAFFNDPLSDYLCERALKIRGAHKANLIPALKATAVVNGEPLAFVAFDKKVINATPKHVVDVLLELARYGISPNTLELIRERVQITHATELAQIIHDLWNVDRWQAETKTEGVYVGTIHSAKGREFDAVYLPGWEQAHFPGGGAATMPARLEEQRRLAYVGITRARSEVAISWCRERKLEWNTVADLTPSQFIAEAGL